jgi:hypothetical protein
MDINSFFLAGAPKAQRIVADLRTIRALEAQLTETDYQIIKCYEYSLVGLELPYDIQALHEEREAIRE